MSSVCSAGVADGPAGKPDPAEDPASPAMAETIACVDMNDGAVGSTTITPPAPSLDAMKVELRKLPTRLM